MRIVVALIEAILKVLEKSKESKKTDDSDKFVINDLAYRLNGSDSVYLIHQSYILWKKDYILIRTTCRRSP